MLAINSAMKYEYEKKERGKMSPLEQELAIQIRGYSLGNYIYTRLENF